MSYTKVETHVTQALDNFVYQFKDKPKLAAWITSYINQIQDLENMWYSLLVERWLENAVGVQLDNFGTIVLELRQGKDDDDYRFAIQGKIKLLRSQGTPTDVVQGMEFFAAGTYELIEVYPATIRVRLVDALTSAFPTLDQFAAFVDAVKPAGVQAWFQYALSDDENTFRFQDVEYQDTMIIGEDASRVGGYVMHDEGDGVIRNLGTGDAATNNGATNVITDLGDGLSFDGVDDFLNAGQVGSGLTDDFTLSAWIKTTFDTGRIIARREGAVHFDWAVAGGGHLVFYDGTSTQQGVTNLLDNYWHHVAVVIDGTNSQFYVDGSTDGAAWPKTVTAAAVTTIIGAYNVGGSGNFDGDIVDPQIFSEAKDATWVAAEYAKGITAMANNQSADYPVHRAHIDTLDSSLVAAYRMKPTNGVTGTNVPNLVGGAEAAVNNGATFEYTEMGDALLFDGVDDFVNAGQIGASLTDDFTLSAWVKTSANNIRLISRRDGGGTHFDWHIQTTTGYPRLYDGITSYVAASAVDDGRRHHMAMVINGAASQFYIDGAPSGSTFNPTITTYVTDTIIGAWNTGASNNWDGHIVDPQIHDEAKDAAWVLAEYNKGVAAMALNPGLAPSYNINTDDADLISAYDMNISVASTLPDIVGSNDGTITDAVYQSTGEFPHELAFDTPATNKVALGNSIAPSALTVSLWVKFNTVSRAQFLFNKYLSGLDGWGCAITSAAKLVIFDDIDGAGRYQGYGNVVVDTWYHVVATMAPTTFLNKLYLDGVVEGTNGNSTAALSSFTGDSFLGWKQNGETLFGLDGEMTRVQIFETEKDQAWVDAEYAKGLAIISGATNPPSQGWADDTPTTQGGYWSDIHVIGE